MTLSELIEIVVDPAKRDSVIFSASAILSAFSVLYFNLREEHFIEKSAKKPEMQLLKTKEGGAYSMIVGVPTIENIDNFGPSFYGFCVGALAAGALLKTVDYAQK